jgi:hypothetical protein
LQLPLWGVDAIRPEASAGCGRHAASTRCAVGRRGSTLGSGIP